MVKTFSTAVEVVHGGSERGVQLYSGKVICVTNKHKGQFIWIEQSAPYIHHLLHQHQSGSLQESGYCSMDNNSTK